ncbi:MAG: PIN domain-containing protein [SAR324 cluster bacterium]|nr:PIN domain-containing protein [SAR324 cluster bacterium]
MKRALLDTNIIIHRETAKIQNQGIGVLFNWLDKLKYEKCIHPLTIDEISKYGDQSVVDSFKLKMMSYSFLKTEAPDNSDIESIRKKFDQSENDEIDSKILNELLCDRVDIIITEDKKLNEKAKALKLHSKVYSISRFLEKAESENPSLTEYKALTIRPEYFGRINLSDPFFDSLKEDYAEFSTWYNKKSDFQAYQCVGDDGELQAFLYLKQEGEDEIYRDITPSFSAKNRLKIGTFKVIYNGFRLGERFLKIIFDHALKYSVDEIYVTIFNRSVEQKSLIRLFLQWGFKLHGQNSRGEEVYTRSFKPVIESENPAEYFPNFSKKAKKFVVSIKPEFHTDLFPDSILTTENPEDFKNHKANRNALRKVYVSWAPSQNRELQIGDILVFYRMKEPNDPRPAYHRGCVTTVGVVDATFNNIPSEQIFIELCRNRSVYSSKQLSEFWKYYRSRPYVVSFLYNHSLDKKPILADLADLGIVEPRKGPRGFVPIQDDAFLKLMEIANADTRLIVD